MSLRWKYITKQLTNATESDLSRTLEEFEAAKLEIVYVLDSSDGTSFCYTVVGRKTALVVPE